MKYTVETTPAVPAMMTAMRAAGIQPKTKHERIWNLINDAGEMTAARVTATAPDLSKAYVSQMASMGGLATRYERRASSGGFRRVAVYSTAHDTWEEARDTLRSYSNSASKARLSPGAKKSAKKSAMKPAAVTAPTNVVMDAPPKVADAPPKVAGAPITTLPAVLENMTLAQLRVIYSNLKRIFE